MRRPAATAAVLSLLAVGIAALPAGAEDPTDRLPDLVADPVTGARLEEYGSATSLRRLLRFDGYVHNAGVGAVAVRGSDRAGTVMDTTAQLVDQSSGGPDERPMPVATSVRWEPDDSHFHWHLRSAARYSLWDQQGAALIGAAEKVGFCLLDSQPVTASWGDNRFTSECEKFNRETAEVTMGVSPGFRDVYSSKTAFQWVDVSDVPPGNYLIRSEVDPDDVIDESDETNAPANVPVTIPGWVAQPTAAVTIGGGPVSVQPSAAAVGVPRAGAEFRVEDPPAQGTLSVAAGRWFQGPVRYTPAPGWSGADTFTVSAREAQTHFPRSPARATITIGSGTGTGHRLAISGAPASVRTGSVTRLSATLARGADPAEPADVAWTADHGTVTPEGVFTAPAEVPPGEAATVRARAASGLAAEVRMTVWAPAAAAPAPSPGPGTGVLRLSARRAGGRIVVAVVPRRPGRLRMTVLSRGRRVSGCRRRVLAGRSYACSVRAPRHGAAARIVASLRARDGRLLRQRLRLRARRARAAGHPAGPHAHGS